MMPGVAQDVVALLYALLPGFLAAWVFYGLTAHPKPSPFERTVQALVYTLIVQVFLAAIRSCFLSAGAYGAIGMWAKNVDLAWSLVIAVFVGLIFAGFANNSTIHSWLRVRNWWLAHRPLDDEVTRWRWTKRTSYPSEWFGAFNDNRRYVVLHLVDGRRLYGWPEEWPDQPDSGHFVIAEAEWLVDDKAEDKIGRIPLTNVWNILIPAEMVQLVEFMFIAENSPGETDGPQATAATAEPTKPE